MLLRASPNARMHRCFQRIAALGVNRLASVGINSMSDMRARRNDEPRLDPGPGIDDVVRTLRFANARRIAVVTRAAGTGLAGGANAVDGCILLSVAGLDRILHLDPVGRLAVVEPGVLNGTLAAEAQARGLFYAPDPASRDISSIRGRTQASATPG